MSGDAPGVPEGGTVRATLLVVLSACCFGSIAPLTVVATRGGAALPAVQAWRYLASALLLSLVAALVGRRAAAPAPWREGVRPWWHPGLLLVAGGGQATVATLSLSALRYLPAATVGFLFYTFPAWVALLAAARGQEPIDRRRALALLLALGGVAAMVGSPAAGSIHPVGAALALGAAAVYAAYIPLLGRLQLGREPLELARAIAWGGAAIFLAWAGGTGVLLARVDAVTLGASALQGVLSAGAFLAFLAGLRALGPVRAAITSTAEPFWTTLLASLLLAQPVGPATLGGGIGIMGAVVLLQRGGAASRQRTSPPPAS